MVRFDHTYPTAAENVAAEQALLDFADSNHCKSGFLRFWEPRQLMVVVGRGGRVRKDVHVEVCANDQVPILRRTSGGGTILGGPGCLMYTVVVSLETYPALRDIALCHQWIGERMRLAYSSCGHQVELRGHSDLCAGDRKISGNAMRLGRKHLIYHGTLLREFDLHLIPRYLKIPERKPQYRGDRNHLEFVSNLPVKSADLQTAIADAFNAKSSGEWPVTQESIDHLLVQRYNKREWNQRI